MKITLGKSPEEQAAEEAKRQRELEAQIQQSMLERQQKINALHKKQKSNKIIIISFTSIIVIALLVFGTYNTFFKQGLQIDDVNNQIAQSTNRLNFPSEGLDNYIRDNSQAFFNKYASTGDNDQIEYANVDKNSVNISKVVKMSNTLSVVYFSADIEVKNEDTQVVDQAIIEKLKKNGFGIKSSEKKSKKKNKEENTEAENVEESTEVSTEEATVAEQSEETLSNEGAMPEENVSSEESAEEPATEEATTEEATTEDTSYATTNLEMSSDETSDVIEYYMLDSGVIMQRGATSKIRYSFCIPVEVYYTYEDPETKQVPITNGFRPAGEMTLYSLKEIDINTVEDPIEIHPYLQFDAAQAYEESEKESAKIRVDKIFNEIYSGINTDHELKLKKQFNTYDATYIGMVDFEIYKTPNQLGYNAHVTYKIQLPQGFTYVVENYLIVEKDGGSWIITSIL